MEPIAITGFAFKLPQGAEDEQTLWDILKTGRNVMTTWPESRANIASVYESDSAIHGTIPTRGAHFFKDDPAAFDAPFFSITSKEAASMDPQQRLLLETTYRALENAGIPIEQVAGTNTGVFGGSMSDDYLRMITKDPDEAPTNTASGASPAILANRLSWYFDLRGPSIQVDTACSSSMISTHLAVQSLQSGQTSMALATGSNVILNPERSVYLSSMNFLSPEGLSYSFDHRASGYGRGEGVVVLVLKRLHDAIRDRDRIRAVLRASGSNQDGRTPGITQPSLAAQEKLIRDVYKSCNIGFESTRYVEAHGTGTQIGDSTEAAALGKVFRTSRSTQQPLYIGSLKANFGHVEGASGVAGILKCILILEKGIIPPNALFERWNPKIKAKFNNLQVATSCIQWPDEGLRRISVNSFGFGGSNGHLIIDDALSTLESLAVNGYRPADNVSLKLPRAHRLQQEIPLGYSGLPSTSPLGGSTNESALQDTSESPPTHYLLVWSAKDEASLTRVIQQYTEYLESQPDIANKMMDQLAYTLATRRSIMTWRTFAVVTTEAGPEKLRLLEHCKGERVSRERGIAFVFTGQGAQFTGMGLGLVHYPIFKSALDRADAIFHELGAQWSLIDELQQEGRINTPQLSQPICTALQIAQLELLASFDILPEVVVGHSSGEIAAAYAVGALSFESACKVAFHRGRLVEGLIASSSRPGAMMSVNLPESDVASYLKKRGLGTDTDVYVACINSPFNVTMSGDETVIDEIKDHLDREGIFAQKLRTGVAYHSPAMSPIAEEYLDCLGSLESSAKVESNIFMVSSVTGQRIAAASLGQAQYWVDNLLSPVRFTDAVQYIVVAAPKADSLRGISDFVEIGPHSALRRPVVETVSEAKGGRNFRYSSMLSKFEPPSKTTLNLAGQLFARGYPVSLTAVMKHDQETGFLVDLPPYPFDHSQLYWHETRLSRDWRLRGAVPRQVLGIRATDWNPLQPRWRKTLSIGEMPWLADHVVGETILFPATGTLMMALEAVKQMNHGHKDASGFHIKEATFSNPIVIRPEGKTEVITHLSPLHNVYEKTSSRFAIKVFSYLDTNWTECFKATIHVEYRDNETEVDGGQEARATADALARESSQTISIATRHVSKEDFYVWMHKQGLRYGRRFSLADDIYWDGNDRAVAHVNLDQAVESFEGIVHPAVLDASCQVAYTAPSEGMSKILPTFIPHTMRDAWISPTQWQSPSTSQIRITTRSKTKSTGAGIESSVTVQADDGSILFHVQRFALSPILSRGIEEDSEKRLLHRIEWKPYLPLLNSDSLQEYCKVDATVVDDEAAVPDYCELTRILRSVIQRNLGRLLETDWSMAPSHMQKYASWMEKQASISMPSPIEGATYEDNLEHRLGSLLLEQPSWEIFIEVARCLPAVIRGDLAARELVSPTAATSFHDGLISHVCSSKLASYLALLVHQNPAQKLLEIGSGSSVMSDFVHATLQEVEDRTGGISFVEYLYTARSDSSIENAKMRSDGYQGRMNFKVLDFRRDITSQGLQPASYDVILAGNLSRSVENLSTILRNIRLTLRPGGHLIFYETTVSPFLSTFAFGTMESWWSGEEELVDWHSDTAEPDWDKVLKENGFSGQDLVIRDYQNNTAHSASVMISTAEGSAPIASEKATIFMVVDEEVKAQHGLALSLANDVVFDSSELFQPRIVYIDDLEDAAVKTHDYVIVLADFGESILADLSKRNFELIRAWIKQTKKLLWVTQNDISMDSTNTPLPFSAMKDGLLRTLRAEMNNSHIVSLSIEGAAQNTASHAKHISKVFNHAFSHLEVEYLVRDGQVLIARLIEEVSRNAAVTSTTRPEIHTRPWIEGPPLKLDMWTRGQMDTLHFKDDTDYRKPLPPDGVEVESKAWAVNFRDMFGALGRLDEDFSFGSDCAGVVTRVGAKCKLIQPGDRVCMAIFGCMRTYPRSTEWAVAKIPDSLGFEEACAVINPAYTSWQSLVEVARLQKGEKILIHSAAGATGQLAIQIAQLVGAEVFATVGYNHKKQLLIDQYNLPADHIFYSRNTTFASGVMRVTNGYGVDVVLNSLVGEGLRASWECIAPHGRFIEIGKADISANASLPMSFFAKNVTFAAVDLLYIFTHKQEMAGKLLRKTMELAGDGCISYPKPLHIYDVCAVEDAFRYLQSGENTGRIVIRVDPSTVVQKHLLRHTTWKFDTQASYVVAGGLGGIGRSILKWMVTKGAKHLIVPSRSGLASEAAAEVVRQLSEQGVTIATPKCDVSSLDSLSPVLEECKLTMPPIRGCINATMVLQDAVFDNMTHDQWERTTRSKVQSSWNLHSLLPDLDFFILLSSVSGIIGNPGQANYASGCTFQDSLARYRALHGQKAMSIDLGPMSTVGVVAETESLQKHFSREQGFIAVAEHELLSLLDMCCDPSSAFSADESQITLGISTPADMLAQSLEPTEFMQRPMFAYFSQMRCQSQSSGSANNPSAAYLFQSCNTAEGRTLVVVEALTKKLARALSMKAEDVDIDQPLHAFGVDSLVAVELRNWMAKDFAADVPVFEITGGRTVAAIGELVTRTSQIGMQQ